MFIWDHYSSKFKILKKVLGGGGWDMNNLLCMKKSNICLQFKKTEEGVQIEFPDLNNLWSMRVEQVGFVCIKRQTKWFEFSSCRDSRLFTLFSTSLCCRILELITQFLNHKQRSPSNITDNTPFSVAFPCLHCSCLHQS